MLSVSGTPWNVVLWPLVWEGSPPSRLRLQPAWGRASYGGVHPGVLPSRLRVVSAGTALLYCGLTVAVVNRHTPVKLRRQVLTGVTTLMGVGAFMNGISPSWRERAIWTPTTAVMAALAWRAREDF